MKKLSFLVVLALGFIPIKLSAQDLVFNMTEDSGVKIVNGGNYDSTNKCIGNTGEGTTICLGEVDFGDGTKYAGTAVLQAQESGDMEGYIDFYLGNPDDGGVLINDVKCCGTGGWQYYRTYRYNFYPEGSDVARPTGKGDVYVRFRDGEDGVKYYCNLKRVTFYTKELSEEEMGLQADPVYTFEEYFANGDMEIVEKAGSDAHVGDDGQIGWTESGVTAMISGADFSDGQYTQIAAYMTHQGTDLNARLKVYIDEVNDDNLIANIWVGRDYGTSWTLYDYAADDVKKTVTGTHDIYLVWENQCNLIALRLCEGHPYEVEYGHEWLEGKQDEPVEEEPTLSDNAYTMTFDSMGGVENSTEIVNKGTADNGAGARYESANIGYTSNGVVVRFNDVDFKNGDYNRIVVESSTDQSDLGKNASFDFYIDLPTSLDFSDMNVFADYDKVASVKAPATGNWSAHKLTAGELSEVVGVHSLYMVWNVPNGCNVFSVSLDNDGTDGIKEVTKLTESRKYFNLSGQQVDSTYKGVVVCEGQKFLNK